jgi:16S rRNA (guanine966-N2)-methyltransferase
VHSTRTKNGEKAGVVRIIAGEYRGRRIKVPARPGLRPTPDRVRETLFNWLGQWLEGQCCLDLFAGSGALGFEAASRGAARVVMVESDRTAYEALQATRQTIGAAAVDVVNGDGLDYVAREGERFDVVFLDPPFGQNALPVVLERLDKRLKSGARIYVESPEPLPARGQWTELKRSRAGQVSFQLFEWRGDDQGGLSRNV